MEKIKNSEIIVEIPKGSPNKYEYDEFNKSWKLDRVLSGAMFYPEEYGFIPETLEGKAEAEKVLIDCQKLYQKNKHLLVIGIDKKELVKKLQLEKLK